MTITAKEAWAETEKVWESLAPQRMAVLQTAIDAADKKIQEEIRRAGSKIIVDLFAEPYSSCVHQDLTDHYLALGYHVHWPDLFEPLRELRCKIVISWEP